MSCEMTSHNRQLVNLYSCEIKKEVKTRNPVLKTVQENTEAIHAHFLAQGIDTVFQLNPGNHFAQGIERTEAGIRWLLDR